MLRIGIVGAENSHCAHVARICNVHKKVSCRVQMVWGETPELARKAAEVGRIPTAVRDWREMLGKVDGVMIDHRHPKHHAEVATFFVKNKVPCFVDKPFTYTLAEGKRLCALARKKRVCITSFSTIPLQRNFAEFKKALRRIGTIAHLTMTGPVDLKSKYGGIFFYGIHQVDTIIELFGTKVDRVSFVKHGSGGVAILEYKEGPLATMNCVNNGNSSFHWSAVGETGILDWPLVRDEDPYLTGARTFVKMFRTRKEPFSHERLLAPVAVLDAMAGSIRLRKLVRIARVVD